MSASRLLDPALLLVVALGVALYLSRSRDGVAIVAPPPPALRRVRRARILAWCAWATLSLLSMPLVAGTLTGCIEMHGPDLGVALAGKDRSKTALVVLSGSLRTDDASVPPRERLGGAATQRILTAARLWHEQGFGLVVLSGAPSGGAEGMLDLITSLGVPPEIIARELRSTSTRENATYSAEILRERGAQTVVLVTSATHLRRAVKDFKAAGIDVIPAAADIMGGPNLELDSFLPAAGALAQTQVCLHEIFGWLRG